MTQTPYEPSFSAGRLRQLREAAGLSIGELARKVGTARQYLRLLESGEKKSPGVELIYRLADALNVKADDFRI